MSRKDYRKFADIVKFAIEADGTETGLPVIQKMAYEMAKVFHYDNPAFRPYQFFVACGMTGPDAHTMASKI